ncbi:Cytochrome c [Shimia gijangensis]|uniref:Cytochrome c n=1 Tax=Shimia gijangensis TaxID=1470563 RepID=A0A1M6P1M5_9RHOB|nr:c-type cytochrome [Shimia gijangensis]SHK01814.1 Cytochrome c [Shimia gijangensis]
MQKAILTMAILTAGMASAEGATKGEALYLEHCATCHGLDLDGQGPMAGVMVIKPVDLTALTSGNQGVFPVERVVKRIDGRDPLVAHGSPMPVYGHFFEGGAGALKTASGQPIVTSRAIVELVTYIEGKQQ